MRDIWVAAMVVLSQALWTACGSSTPPEVEFDPRMVIEADRLQPPAGYRLLRGIIHTHSPYSHDACDNQPLVDGKLNQQCLEQCRQGMCATLQDFIFLTDHDDMFADYEFPGVLLYSPADGDELIERGGLPVANRILCPDGHRVLVMAGTESAMMPIGLEHHVGDTPEARHQAYDEISDTAIEAFHEAGALVFLQHTEGWDVQQVLDLPIDGVEIYNLHQNTMDNMAAVLQLWADFKQDPESLPNPELVLLAFFMENEPDLMRLSVAAQRKHLVAAMATDAHQNVFSDPAPDGERLDSFRRMMHWFSNYLLVPQDDWDDKTVKAAVASGMMFGGFDYLGYPVGFDFRAEGSSVWRMGQVVPGGEEVRLVLDVPRVLGVPDDMQPPMSGAILKASGEGWEEVASGEERVLLESASSGVYRAVVTMTPLHLRPWLGPKADNYLREVVWIYSNPIWIGPPGG
ncbi:hypothetical protein D6833_05150 [Candidatus Parcubacteria bacterium]|nr:MAG: hypothetical protein D6833_05150 [Candidatus Parcubacteria bacterium]